MNQRAAHTRARAAAAGAAYPRRRSERDAVCTAHRVSRAASAFGEPLVLETYQSALDREERAADTHASLMSRMRHPAQTGPAPQTTFRQALPEAWERR